MKPRSFFLAALVGLACGFLVKWRMSDHRAEAGGPAEGRSLRMTESPGVAEVPPDGEELRKWEARLAPYLTAPPPPSASGETGGPRAEADAVLRLLRGPVTEDSIREGVATFNAEPVERYYDYMAAVFGRWAREAPEAALAAAEGLRDPRQRVALVWKVFQATADDPDILAKAMAQPPGVNRSAAFAALAETVPPERAVELLRESMKDRPPAGRVETMASLQSCLLRKLKTVDPGLPLRVALETEDPAWRTALLQTVGDQAGGPSTEELTALLRDSRNVEGLKGQVWGKAFWEPKEGAVALLAALPDAERREMTGGILGTSIRMLTSEEKVLREQADRENREEKLADLWKELENREGAEGTRAILAESALARGAQGLRDTAAWLVSRHDAAGLEDLTRRAAQTEPFTTARWLAAMPPSADRDRAVAVFAETHAAVDPERAAAWAESIADPGKREAALSAVRKYVPAAR